MKKILQDRAAYKTLEGGGGVGVILTCRSSGLECHARGARGGGGGVCTGAVAIRKAYERYEIKGVNFLYDAALCLTW